jgi:hypothetical protein
LHMAGNAAWFLIHTNDLWENHKMCTAVYGRRYAMLRKQLKKFSLRPKLLFILADYPSQKICI